MLPCSCQVPSVAHTAQTPNTSPTPTKTRAQLVWHSPPPLSKVLKTLTWVTANVALQLPAAICATDQHRVWVAREPCQATTAAAAAATEQATE
jgi:hypothetical protein